MDHLPYILASYALGGAMIVGFAMDAMLRMSRARRRLAAVDPRMQREDAGA